MEKEFYTCDDRVYILADGKSVEFTEKDTELTDEILTKVENFYPEAHKALTECYSKSSLNQPYYRYLMARRFVKCNFGSLDTAENDIDEDGVFHFEKVACPMRGECKFEGLICMPKFSSRLSEAELRVMRLYFEIKEVDWIADQLYLSVHTVKNHIKAAYAKLGIHTRAEFITYANKNNLFN